MKNAKNYNKGLPKTNSSKPGKQRKSQFNAPKHRVRRMMTCRISDDIGKKEGKFYPRSISVVKGDVVRVMRGVERDRKGKITKVDRKKQRVYVEGAVYPKADGTKIPRPIHPSNLTIVTLNENDPKRKLIIKRARDNIALQYDKSPEKGKKASKAKEDAPEETKKKTGGKGKKASKAKEDAPEETKKKTGGKGKKAGKVKEDAPEEKTDKASRDSDIPEKEEEEDTPAEEEEAEETPEKEEDEVNAPAKEEDEDDVPEEEEDGEETPEEDEEKTEDKKEVE